MFLTWWRKLVLNRMQTAARRGDARRRNDGQRRSRLNVEPLEERSLLTITATGIPNWQEQGPGPITRGQVIVGDLVGPNARDDDFVSGAVNAITVDPTDANRVFVGTVNGGIWKTTNALAANPVWEPKTDLFPSLAI